MGSAGIASILASAGPATAPSGPVTTASSGTVLSNLFSGVASGFDADTFAGQNTCDDPLVLSNQFGNSQAHFVPGLSTISPYPLTPFSQQLVQVPVSGSQPSNPYALGFTFPVTGLFAYAQIWFSPLIKVPPEVSTLFGTYGATLYTAVDFWLYLANSTGGGMGVGFELYDVNLNEITPGEFAWFNFALPSSGTWGHYVSNNLAITIRTGGTIAPVSGVTYLRGKWQVQPSSGGPGAAQLTAIHLAAPVPTQTAGLFVSIGPGTFRTGVQQQGFAGQLVQVSNADPSNPRIDLISWNYLLQEITYTPGTAGVSPVVPPTPAFCAPLWQVLVPANASSLSPTDLTDVRQYGAIYVTPDGVLHLNAREVIAVTGLSPAGTALGAPAYASLAAPYANATTGDLSTGTGVSFTALTATARVQGMLRVANNTIGDGVLSKVFLSTVGVPNQGAAPGGTDTAQWQNTDTQEGLAGNAHTQSFDFQLTGLTVGTVYYVYLTIAAVTGGTATASGGHNETTIQATSV
jgi:hypothetical protein